MSTSCQPDETGWTIAHTTAQIDNQVDEIIAQKAALNTQLDLIEIELADQQKLLDRGLAQAHACLHCSALKPS